MPRLTLSLPEEFGPTGAPNACAVPHHDLGGVCDTDPRIVRWLACWAGKAGC